MHRLLEKICHVVPKEGTIVLGGDAGGIRILDFETGAMLVSPKMEDHDGPVTSISINPILQHFLSSGMDGVIKVCCLRLTTVTWPNWLRVLPMLLGLVLICKWLRVLHILL